MHAAQRAIEFDEEIVRVCHSLDWDEAAGFETAVFCHRNANTKEHFHIGIQGCRRAPQLKSGGGGSSFPHYDREDFSGIYCIGADADVHVFELI